MSLYAALAAALLWCASIAGSYFYGVGVGGDHATAQIAREDKVAAIATEAAASAAAVAISQIRVQRTTIQNEVQREISERVVYRECVHSAEQLQRLNAALTGASPEPAGRGLVPAAGALVGRELRGNDGKAGGSGGPVP